MKPDDLNQNRELLSGGKQLLYSGKHVHFVKVGGWEFADRPHISGIVAIVALTSKGEALLVEQFRPPVGKSVIELPAGLSGDVAGSAKEELVEAARRELLEETGYEAGEMVFLTEGPPLRESVPRWLLCFGPTISSAKAQAAGMPANK